MQVSITNRHGQVQFDADRVTTTRFTEFFFRKDRTAIDTYRALKNLGVRCCKTGEHAPEGPSVIVYNYNNQFRMEVK